MSKLPTALQATEEDIRMLLACQVHIGTNNATKSMEPYIYKRRVDGIHLINIVKTWEKLVLAARIIVAIENPEDVVIVSARPYGQRAALKFASFTGARAIAGRFTPGTFTNYITRGFKEPRLIIVTDPRTDHQAVTEAAYVNIPCIAICDSDSLLKYIDVAIPGNNKAKQSLGLIYWLLAREVLRLRGTVTRNTPWNVMVDMFFYRDPEQTEKEEGSREKAIEAPSAYDGDNSGADSTWGDSGAAVPTSTGWDQSGATTTAEWGAPSGGEWGAEAPATTQW